MPNLLMNKELMRMLSKDHQKKKRKLPEIEKVNFSHWNFTGKQIKGNVNQVEVKNYNELLSKGIVIQNLRAALRDPTSLAQQIQGRIITSDENDLVAENYQHYDCGLFIYIPKGISLSAPLEINVCQTTSLNYRLVMLVDDESSVSVVESFESLNSELNSGKIIEEIAVASNATLHLSTIQNLQNTTTYFKQRIDVQQDAQLFWNVEAFNSENNINESDVVLNEKGAQCDLKVITLASQRQVQGFNTKVICKRPNTVAKMLQRAIVLKRARIVFNGIGKIKKGAHGTNLQQENRLLMLSPQASGGANPILLIDENDVQAAHAASIGKIDVNKMYYLMSRGLTSQTAQRMLICSFLNPIIQQIPAKQIRKILYQQIEKRIQDEL